MGLSGERLGLHRGNRLVDQRLPGLLAALYEGLLAWRSLAVLAATTACLFLPTASTTQPQSAVGFGVNAFVRNVGSVSDISFILPC